MLQFISTTVCFFTFYLRNHKKELISSAGNLFFFFHPASIKFLLQISAISETLLSFERRKQNFQKVDKADHPESSQLLPAPRKPILSVKLRLPLLASLHPALLKALASPYLVFASGFLLGKSPPPPKLIVKLRSPARARLIHRRFKSLIEPRVDS